MVFKMISFSALFNLMIVITVNGQDGSSYCSKPIIEQENIVDVKFLHENYKQGWNNQFGNSVLRKRIAELLQGKKFSEEPNYTDMCLRTTFDFRDEHHIVGTIYGFGLDAQWNCTDSNHIYDCNFYSAKTGFVDSAKIYMVYFDGNVGHNSVGLAFCYPDETVGWYASSISKILTDGETKTILDRFKSVGFDANTRVPLRLENCP